MRKLQRRQARAKRAKEEARTKFKEEVRNHIIYKGEVVNVL